MGCNSSYMIPTMEEENKVQTSKLICFVDKKLGIKTKTNILKASKDSYGAGVDLDTIVAELCDKLKSLKKTQVNDIIYNAKDKTSRELADWWEEHQKADKKRIKEEKDEIEKNKLIKSALSKLTAQEKEAIKNIK